MDPLERHFALATLPPAMSAVPSESAARLLRHPTSHPLGYSTIVADDAAAAPHRLALHALAEDAWRWAVSKAEQVTFGGLGRFCDLISFVVLAVIVYRTYVPVVFVVVQKIMRLKGELVWRPPHFLTFSALSLFPHLRFMYVKRRRRGLVGPSLAPLLVKFWIIYGFADFCSHLLSMYLTPMHGGWLVSILRAIGLVILASGHRLSAAERLYAAKLVPLYEAQEPEVEAMFAQARQRGELIDEAFRELATYLLKRIAVGGLSGAVSDISEAVAAGAEGEQGRAGQATQRRGGGAASEGSPLPSETTSNTFSSGRQFFAGVPEERAESIASAGVAGNGIGVIRMAAPAPPKAAYEDLRAFRRKLNSRVRQREVGKEPPP